MSMKALRKALKDKVTDEFPVGTVIRWTASDVYSYAAIKTEVGWYSTAQYGNRYVSGRMDFEEFVEVLSRSETSNILVSGAWTPVE